MWSVEYISISCWYFHGNFTTTSLRSAPYAWHTSHVSTISLSSKTRPVQDGDTKVTTERLTNMETVIWCNSSGQHTGLTFLTVSGWPVKWPFSMESIIDLWSNAKYAHVQCATSQKLLKEWNDCVCRQVQLLPLHDPQSEGQNIGEGQHGCCTVHIWQHSPSWLTHWTLKTRVKAKVWTVLSL